MTENKNSASIREWLMTPPKQYATMRTKATDCVNLDVLIAKLEHYWIQESTLN
jgi:hypothetical protein